ncbi:Hypothetical_protein [Hexamita inflata]|uniref:Hypothetical_protein n=1 Tax=Hexamita inflata TaxID=28002 RepID=A0ABP1GLC4_9EUKA
MLYQPSYFSRSTPIVKFIQIVISGTLCYIILWASKKEQQQSFTRRRCRQQLSLHVLLFRINFNHCYCSAEEKQLNTAIATESTEVILPELTTAQSIEVQ